MQEHSGTLTVLFYSGHFTIMTHDGQKNERSYRAIVTQSRHLRRRVAYTFPSETQAVHGQFEMSSDSRAQGTKRLVSAP